MSLLHLVLFAVFGLAVLMGAFSLYMRLQASLRPHGRTATLRRAAEALGGVFTHAGPLDLETVVLDRSEGRTRIQLVRTPCAHQTRHRTEITHGAAQGRSLPEVHVLTTGNGEPHVFAPTLPNEVTLPLPGLAGELMACAPDPDAARSLLAEPAVADALIGLHTLAGLGRWELAILDRDVRLSLEGFVTHEAHLRTLVDLLTRIAA
jgi:hypothetical protein